tara:strand:- start:850 stop:1011 length:162 start_codon:yes stop_codon:yes gene_type:complete
MAEFGQQFEDITLIPADAGRFEVSIDDDLVFDKKAEGRFPENEEIKSKVREKL